MRSIDDATVSATDRKGLRKQDRVDDIEDVKGAVEGGGAVHVLEERGRVDRECRGAEDVHTVVVEVLCVVGRRAYCSRGSGGRIFGLDSKKDGMDKLDLLLRRGSCNRRVSRRSGRRFGGCSCSCAIRCVTTLLVACVTITKWALGLTEIIVGNCFWHITQVEVEVDGATAARAVGPAGVEDVAES